MNGLESYTAVLRKKGLKATPRRKAVIAFLAAKPRSYAPSEVWEGLKNQFKQLGLPSIYRILEELAGLHLACRIKRDDRQLYYYLCAAEEHHHHHFVCRKCQGVQEVKQCLADRLFAEIEEDLDCRAESHFMQVEGLCRECRDS